ncbi:glycoside hydrolase family 3 C-terminal domain-containing protein [Flavobacterium sp. W21_SRS_FM6]|uniref:glycoside hydrolase family 3 C-terminal domain-containing protein n=1 Tax=Flavobacterium sp. W21_SRS_FM6 TaxID=3240268 RepID=UPI003F8E8944
MIRKIKANKPKSIAFRAIWLSLFVASSMSVLPALATTTPKLGQASLDEVIQALSLEEKVKLVRGTGMNMGDSGPTVGQTKDKVPGAAGTTYAIPRLGIPSIVLADGPAGLRIAPTRDDDKDHTYYATAFPIANLLSSSWDLSLVEQVGQAIGAESKEYGVDVLLAPALNIHRFALGGRNFEYYSEDPLLSGKMAAAMVRGVQSQGVGTSLKHFVANNHEWNRNTIDVQLDERALREIYLRGFEIAVKESQPWTVMSSYNKVNGEYTSESAYLLTEVLRDQWGFNGVVMTDWFGGKDAAQQMAAGNDLLMPGMDYQEGMIIGAIKSGKLDEAKLDRNVKNILQLVQASPAFSQYAYSNKPDLIKHGQLSKTVAEEGMVLLKNNAQTLPLQDKQSLALFGNHSFDVLIGGTGSGDVNEAYVVTLEDGLKEAGIEFETGLASAYKAHIKTEDAKRPVSNNPLAAFMPKLALVEFGLKQELLHASAQKYSAALVTIGRSSGEFVDRQQSDFYLTEQERAMLDMVSSAFRQQGKPVVVILNVGGVIEMASWQDKADAILLAYQPGQEAGNAIVDLLLGHTNPSGKLPDTWPLDLPDYPAAKEFPGTVLDPEAKPEGMMQTVPAKVTYDDGIMLGYRYFNTQNAEVAYPFGFGLSYTDFTYSAISLSSQVFSDKIVAQITVKNSGKVAGKEVVQIYVSAPQTNLVKPESELRAFAKTTLLQPGESEVLSFELSARDLSSFDQEHNMWLAQSGEYVLKAGTSSREILQSARFSLPKDLAIKP